MTEVMAPVAPMSTQARLAAIAGRVTAATTPAVYSNADWNAYIRARERLKRHAQHDLGDLHAAVTAVLKLAIDGDAWEHPAGAHDDLACPACWSERIHGAVDQALKGDV